MGTDDKKFNFRVEQIVFYEEFHNEVAVYHVYIYIPIYIFYISNKK